MIRVTPLEAWIGDRAGIERDLSADAFLEKLHGFQLRQLNESIAYARGHSPFYRRLLASWPSAPLSALAELARLPFTTASELAGNPASFLAVRQDDIARIVTLRSSGSTGEAKRLFFTADDLELTVDFFHHGMSTLVRPGQRVAVFLPGEAPDSVGDLLVRGLARMEVQAKAFGPVMDTLQAVAALVSWRAHCIVGIPTQILALARSPTGAAIGKGVIDSVLLSTDYVPLALAEALTEVWGCRVFSHYGMTEMGLGGGVECEALDGYHLRETDLFFEVVDPETGAVCADGALGELVFSTLGRRGMPLIRYRTGDIARMLSHPCPCGSALRRLERVRGRWQAAVSLGPRGYLTISELDEALFRLPGLLDYRVTLSRQGEGRFRLLVDVHSATGSPTERAVRQALAEVGVIRASIAAWQLEELIVRFSPLGRWSTNGVAKRKIVIDGDPPS